MAELKLRHMNDYLLLAMTSLEIAVGAKLTRRTNDKLRVYDN
jgi:hypothetical protein